MESETKTVQKIVLSKEEQKLKKEQEIIKIRKKIIKVNSIGGYLPVKANAFVKIISKKLDLIEGDIESIVCNFIGKLTADVNFVIKTKSGEEIYRNVLFSEFNIPERIALYTACCTRKEVELDVANTETGGVEKSNSEEDNKIFERIIQVIPKGDNYAYLTK